MPKAVKPAPGGNAHVREHVASVDVAQETRTIEVFEKCYARHNAEGRVDAESDRHDIGAEKAAMKNAAIGEAFTERTGFSRMVMGRIQERIQTKNRELEVLKSEKWHYFEKWVAWEAYFALNEGSEKWTAIIEPYYRWWCSGQALRSKRMYHSRADLVVAANANTDLRGTVIIEIKVCRYGDPVSSTVADRRKMHEAAGMQVAEKKPDPGTPEYLQPRHYVQMIVGVPGSCDNEPGLPWERVYLSQHSGMPIGFDLVFWQLT